MKLTEDFESLARGLLVVLAVRAEANIEDRRIKISFPPETIHLLAGDLLEVYLQGWDERSTEL